MKALWPIFIKYIWPEISEYVLSLVRAFADYIKELIESLIAERGKREKAAKNNEAAAQQAEGEATAAGDPVEAEVQRRIAELWREVADDLRRENDKLKEQLSTLAVKTDDLVDSVEHGIKLDMHDDHPRMTLGGRTVEVLEPPVDAHGITCPVCGARIS